MSTPINALPMKKTNNIFNLVVRMNVEYGADMEKVASMQALLADNFGEKMWIFLDNPQISCSVYPSNPTSVHYYLNIIHYC